MTDRPSASWIRDQLRKIHTEKQNHVHRHGKYRPEHWHHDYQDAITALHWAAIGYDKLAERESA